MPRSGSTVLGSLLAATSKIHGLTRSLDGLPESATSENRAVTDAAEFVDNALQAESSWQRQSAGMPGLPDHLGFYGTSVGAVRGTIRDALKRYPGLSHDEITALSSELWAVPVYEMRFAAIVLLQSAVTTLRNSDLTRIEGFLRSAAWDVLVDPLATDVISPLVAQLSGTERMRADAVLDRWAHEADAWLQRAAAQVAARIGD